MNGYICYWRGKRCEVYANTLLEARDKAVAKFKARKPHEVSATLAEKNGEPVVYTGAEFG